MSAANRDVPEIFAEALECASTAERDAYLGRACGDDPVLHARVEALLRAHGQAGGFLQGPSPAQAPSTVLGPYRLLEPIGEGGFGVVYRAEQEQPIRRRVAVKVIKPGMDSRQVIARFEAERQTLALMEHPHIARVLDAGQAPALSAGGPSRPYFVMELVEGVPLTDYCDRERLAPRDRLELFVSVCQAVQHAHQKGIIHRDLKPSNVLVTRQDGAPVAKVIDFGIAKALDQRLTDKALTTGAAQVLGTPLYMSPEQAGPGGSDIDTRSDVYSLGVLLYELLTGTTPFDKGRLNEASFDELRRIIREEEPPKPSTRVSTLGPAAMTLSGQRRTDPKQLGQLLRGELDWIVMKCLEKDRNRRYESASALARDIGRFLADEPVEAGPPSAGYRLLKFARRRRRALMIAGAFLGLLVGGGATVAWQAVRLARAERDLVVQQARRSRDVRAALDRAAELRGQARSDPGKWTEARAMITRAEALVETGPVEPELAERVIDLRRQTDQGQKDRDMLAALEDIRLRQAELRGEQFATQDAGPRYAAAFGRYGFSAESPDSAARQLRDSAIREELLAALDNWAWSKEPSDPERASLRAAADGADENAWRRGLRDAVSRADVPRLVMLAREPGALEQPAAVLALLGEALQRAGRAQEAVDWLRAAQERHVSDFWLNHHLAYVLFAVMEPPRADEAVGYFRAAAALRPESPAVHYNLGNALRERGDLPAAMDCYRRALALDRRYVPAYVNLGVSSMDRGDPDAAATWYRQALDIDPTHATARANLGGIQWLRGDRAAASENFRRVIAEHPTYAPAHNGLGALLQTQGDLEGAADSIRRAIAYDPKLAMAHFNLGVVTWKRGDVTGAAGSFRRAAELKTKYADAHYQLARAEQARQNYAAAEASYRRLLELRPKDAKVHCDLGLLLARKGDTPAAVASYRMAVALDPTYAEAHCNLGNALIPLGDFGGALDSLRAGHDLGSKRANWRNPSAEWLKECERWIDLETRLPAILKGTAQPAGAAERIEYADLCRYKGMHNDSVRFFNEAFAGDPALATDTQAGHRYRAAGSAVLAGCGRGEGAARLDEADRAALRRQALDWLRADLTGRVVRLERDRQSVRAELRYWQGDTALAGVRDAGLLAKLPADERDAWQPLWADVAAALARTAEPE